MAAVVTGAAWRSRIVGSGEVDPADLIANPRNWRTHPRHQRQALAGMLAEVGWVQSVIVNQRTGHLVDGHLRVELAAAHGDQVPVVYVDLSEEEEALVLAALDPLAALAGSDKEKLAELLAGVQPEAAELRQVLADLARGAGLDKPTAGLTDEDEPGPVPATPHVQLGDVWALGPHRLVVGDCGDPAILGEVAAPDSVDLVWTDPPYGVSYVGKTAEALTIQNDAMSPAALAAFLTERLSAARAALRPGGVIYVASPGGDRLAPFLTVLLELGLYRQTITWVKDVFVLGRSDYHWRHELLHLGVREGQAVKASSPMLYGWRRGAAHYFVPDRDLDTVWEIPRPKASIEHPTMKPVELVRRCLSFSSRRGDTVLDLFLGSGTTLIAAETIGRRCLAVELEPRYAQSSIERWEAFTGKKADRLGSSQAVTGGRSAPLEAELGQEPVAASAPAGGVTRAGGRAVGSSS